ncbi:MAG: EamA family transporter [Gammaproteobacteria bacterium]|nr:EamA family transporter [Gammaproteobacteria bacterium]
MRAVPAVWYALVSAALFGASVPLSKVLLEALAPNLLAGLLYLGSGLGLTLLRLLGPGGRTRGRLAAGDWPWLGAAIVCGGVLGPLLLLYGLLATSGVAAALLLNLETVFTALLAWLAFRENAGARVVIGMVVIVAGSVVLSGAALPAGGGSVAGMLAIAGACLCWALDNNFTRRVAAADPLVVAASKGLVAGVVNTALAAALGAGVPPVAATGAALLLGFGAYGVSLVLFVLALRDLGVARTSAYFSTAPFLGAVVAVVVLGEPVSPALGLAGALMGLGVWLHLTERHSHEHRHPALDHSHEHVHDAHHSHRHDFEWHGEEPHTHPHHHEPMVHEHPHYPDIHHHHAHRRGA